MAHQVKSITALALGLGLLLAQTAPAQAQAKKGAEKAEKPEMAAGGMFKCVDADGAVTYTNVGSVKGCKKIEGEVNSVSMSRPSAPSGAGNAKGPAKVETGAQRVRDTDRKRILEEELAAEEKRLSELKKEFNNGEPERQGDERNYQKYLDRTEKLKADVARSEANVDSLKRELGGIRN
jgi:hypothetical protein